MSDPSWAKFAPMALPAGAPSKAGALSFYKVRSGDAGATTTTPAFCQYYDEILENMRQQVEPQMLLQPPRPPPQNKPVLITNVLQQRVGGAQPSSVGGGGGGSTSGLFARPSSKHQPEAEAASMSVALVLTWFGEKFSPEGVMVTSIVTIKPNQVISQEV